MALFSSLVGTRLSLGLGSVEELDAPLQSLLLTLYNERHPDAQVYARNAKIGHRNPVEVNFLHNKASFLKYIVLDGRRIVPSTSKYKGPDSIIQARFSDKIYVGQVIQILTHKQAQVSKMEMLLLVLWFKPLATDVLNSSIWDT